MSSSSWPVYVSQENLVKQAVAYRWQRLWELRYGWGCPKSPPSCRSHSHQCESEHLPRKYLELSFINLSEWKNSVLKHPSSRHCPNRALQRKLYTDATYVNIFAQTEFCSDHLVVSCCLVVPVSKNTTKPSANGSQKKKKPIPQQIAASSFTCTHFVIFVPECGLARIRVGILWVQHHCRCGCHSKGQSVPDL